MFRFRPVLAALALLALAACQPGAAPTGGPAPRADAASPKATSGEARALSFAEIRKLFAGRSFSVPGERLNGKDDAFKQSITFVRADTNRAYRYYPNWPGKGRDYSALGALTRDKVQGVRVFAGQSFSGIDAFCLTDELSRNSKACSAVFEKDGAYYLGPDETARIQFAEGYDALLGPLVKRAVADDNNTLLWALAGDFGLKQPELVAKYQRADARVWASNVAFERRMAAEAKAEADRAAAARATRARAEEERRQASCRRKTGKACPTANGGLLGAALVKGVEIWQQAAEDVANGTATYTPTDSAADSPDSPAAAPAASGSAGRSCGQIGCGGVKRIVDNGQINGNPSYRIDCQADSAIVVRKPGQWTSGTGATYSDRTWNLSLQEFGAAMCQ